ncbi:MAG: hypothetical protein H0W34_08300 [Pyrinomonadaceae bacterium]|nr:hypothetical protein [Pyrinomonadaceae bacterium]
MRFLKWFFLTLKEWFLKPDTHPGTIIGANENLSRFIFSTRYFSRQALRVKAEAYMPKEGEVSVFRVDRLTAVQIWKIGDEIADERNRTLYARGDIQAREVTGNGLDILSEEPPPRHANIVGWPENDKPRQKLIALQIAALATLVLKEQVTRVLITSGERQMG